MPRVKKLPRNPMVPGGIGAFELLDASGSYTSLPESREEVWDLA